VRRTTGALAYWSAIGGDFLPLIAGPEYAGVDQGDGTYVTVLAHADGRTLALRTRRGDGWQHGPFVDAVGGGPWRAPVGGRCVKAWRGVRLMLVNHDAGREEPYCGGPPTRQPRPLDGRERDILCRILRDIERALRDGGEQQQRLLDVVDVEQSEVHRLLEMRVILDARDD
jgi:hypothetical protein